METVLEFRSTVLGQRKHCQQRQGEKLLRPKERDGRRSGSNLQRQAPNIPTQDHEEFQPKVESESLQQQEQDGRECTASEESSVVVVQNSKARHQARAFRFCIVDSGVNKWNRLVTNLAISD